MTAPHPSILWFRSDLRLLDNPALDAAIERGRAVLPVFILDDVSPGAWKMGGASRWWLHRSLGALDADLRARGAGPLVFLKGDAFTQMMSFAREVNAEAVFWNRVYEPWAMERDARIKDALKRQGAEARSFSGGLLCEPWEIKNKAGGDYKVFTPFSRACLEFIDCHPGRSEGSSASVIPQPRIPRSVRDDNKETRLDDLKLLPSLDWHSEMGKIWTPGEAGALARLDAFAHGVADYKTQRDFPAKDGVSRLSPHLHFGEVSPWRVWRVADDPAYRRQLLWREFSHHLLYHYPALPDAPWDRKFRKFPWKKNAKRLAAWQRGMTGYPIVDAGMRQLWRTGWMHNRVRMIAGSFLVKNLLIDWREGERWFWDTLVDADLANNAAGWQWIAGCGADAAPYFRIFNPVLQSRKFDPDGAYIRAYVPEIAGLPDKYIHAPWEAPEDIRAKHAAGYPPPLVDHAESRDLALKAYEVTRAA